MKSTYFNFFICSVLGLFFTISAQASQPLWTFSAPTPSSITVSVNTRATIQYTVTNQSSRSKNLVLQSTPGLIASPCYLPKKGSTCTLTLTVLGNEVPLGGIHNGPVLCEQNSQCYQPSKENSLSIEKPILSTSLTSLALSVTNLYAPSGQARNITITNNSPYPVTNLVLDYPTWPIGTSVDASSTCISGSDLAANGGSCTIVIKPGSAATSNCVVGNIPTPGVIHIHGNNPNGNATTAVSVLILSYGCQYQGGFIFAIDDSTEPSMSIGGKVVTTTNQAAPWIFGQPLPGPGKPWDADPACVSSQCSTATGALDECCGENLASVPGSNNPFGTGVDGPGDSYLNSSVLNGNSGNSNISPATYATGVCISYTGGGYSNWYLPAVCELSVFGGSCPSDTQSIGESLGLFIANPLFCSAPSGTECFYGRYWSSTESSQEWAWGVSFFSPFSVISGQGVKYLQNGVRCVRHF